MFTLWWHSFANFFRTLWWAFFLGKNFVSMVTQLCYSGNSLLVEIHACWISGSMTTRWGRSPIFMGSPSWMHTIIQKHWQFFNCLTLESCLAPLASLTNFQNWILIRFVKNRCFPAEGVRFGFDVELQGKWNSKISFLANSTNFSLEKLSQHPHSVSNKGKLSPLILVQWFRSFDRSSREGSQVRLIAGKAFSAGSVMPSFCNSTSIYVTSVLYQVTRHHREYIHVVGLEFGEKCSEFWTFQPLCFFSR